MCMCMCMWGVLLLSFLLTTIHASVPHEEVENLFTLYINLGGDQWTWRTAVDTETTVVVPEWNFTIDRNGNYMDNPCASNVTTRDDSSGSGEVMVWQGLTCSLQPTQCVTQVCHIQSIVLRDYNLMGNFPTNMSSQYVKVLDLSMNSISGSLPHEFNFFPALDTLSLEQNALTGTIPIMIPLLTHLISLDLSDNSLIGIIPHDIGELTELTKLDLGVNNINGTIPGGIKYLKKMILLDLKWNRISGSMPIDIAALSNLEAIDISVNVLSGTLPTELCSLSKLVYLECHRNFFTGPIPHCIGNISRLTSLNMNRNFLSSTIPESLTSLSRLRVLNLEFNALTGPLHVGIYQHSNLTLLSLTENKLQIGSLPSLIGNLVNLRLLSLAACTLTGEIPPELWQLTSLEILYINKNALSGTLPPSIGNLANASVLFLHSNQISGTLPTTLSNLSNAKRINLFGNFLSGKLPENLHEMKQLVYFAVGMNSLTGELPRTLPPNINAIYFYDNTLTGTISSTFFTSAPNLKAMWLNGNVLSGHFPSSIELLRFNLLELRVYDNMFSGPITPELGKLRNILLLEFHNNIFTGPLLEDFNNCFRLQSLSFARNRLTGSLPALGDIEGLRNLWLYDNHLSGSIPDSYGLLQNIVYLEVDGNLLTGTIPSTFGNLHQVEQLVMFSNMLTGSIPPSLAHLPLLERFFCDNNHLTGTLPATLGNMTTMEYMQISENMFSGHIPDELGNLINLEGFLASMNLLEGQIPSSLSKLLALETLVLQGNLITGKLDGVFESQQDHLFMIDLSNNMITGSLPDSPFSLPSLETLVLSVNCFSTEIPQSVCKAQNLSVLCLDGLRGASGCSNSFVVPFSNVALFNTIDGSIPSCVWTLPKLTHVHMAGNGLTGSISSPHFSTLLKDVVISHNQLSGTIPRIIQNLPTIDLSHNSFYGHLNFNSSGTSESMRIAVNRLSGVLDPSSWILSSEYLDILESNLFDCSFIPENDEYYHFYTCESADLDLALYLLLCALFTAFVMVLAAYTLVSTGSMFAKSPLISKLRRVAGKYRRYLNYFDDFAKLSHFRTVESELVYHFVQSLNDTVHALVGLAVVMFICSLPVYLLKSMEYFDWSPHKYTTYIDTYRWFWTFAYITGGVPAAVILVGWVIVISVYYWYGVVYIPTLRSTRAKAGRTISISMNDNVEPDFKGKKIVTFSLFVLNASINAAVNGSYIFLSLQNQSSTVLLLLQMCMAVFKLLYTLIAVPLLASHIPESNVNVWFRMLLLIVNNLIIPCFTVAVESPSCFQGVFFKNHEISAVYTIDVCTSYAAFFNQKFCTEEIFKEVEIAPLTPPFSYNYQCSSAILTAYIPVYLYIYALQILLPFAYVGLLTFFKYDNFPTFMRALLHAIMWPKYFISKSHGQSREDHRESGDIGVNPLHDETLEEVPNNSCGTETDTERENLSCVVADPFLLLDTRDIITTDVLNHFIVLLSFGFCSPMLTLAIATSVYLKLTMWIVLIGRFASYFEHESRIGVATDKIFKILSETCLSLSQTYHITLWPLVGSSTVFYAVFTWDLCSDSDGWQASIWAPISVLCFPGLLKLSSVFVDALRKMIDKKGRGRNIDMASKGVDDGCDADIIMELSGVKQSTAPPKLSL